MAFEVWVGSFEGSGMGAYTLVLGWSCYHNRNLGGLPIRDCMYENMDHIYADFPPNLPPH